ncbi:unnamed protein product [Blumeria hordei]|uniref:Translation initiation factor eIF2B subunit beta n=2 Tax=Blumeria hordei TaxID=2867405 RepID=A0A383V3I4_BLUHO|nr:translation regulator GCD7 [Blumeria hordei DH14]SZF06355.1 unnamed protein product [Blumeria hordei]
MSTTNTDRTLDLRVFLRSLKSSTLESSIENLISLLKRRQIYNSRPCAIATSHLLLRAVAKFRWSDIGKLLIRIREIGQRLVDAQPREIAVGNIVRRVLDMIRDEEKQDPLECGSDSTSNSLTGSPKWKPNKFAASYSEIAHSNVHNLRHGPIDDAELSETNSDDVQSIRFRETAKLSRSLLTTLHTPYALSNGVAVQQSMFNLLSAQPSPNATPPGTNIPQKSSVNASSLAKRIASTTRDLKAEIISGIEEIIDELDQVSDQVAAYAQEHIHSNEVILTHSSSLSVQKFLLKAAEKRKFTVIVTESYPNEHNATHSVVMGRSHDSIDDDEELATTDFRTPLSAAGITVILITDASIFAIMSRVNKVILATHAVIANGGLIAAAGARMIARAAKVHRTPVIVVSGVYKLSPEYPYEFESLIEYGDPGSIVPYADGISVEELEVDNPLYDYVPPELVDLYITNLGAHAPSYLYRIVADHYKPDDLNLGKN